MTNFMLNSLVHAETICRCLGCIPKSYEELEEKCMKWMDGESKKELEEKDFGKYDTLWQTFGQEFFDKACTLLLYETLGKKQVNKMLQKEIERFVIAREVLWACLVDFLYVCKN
jgi:hypothetical protein